MRYYAVFFASSLVFCAALVGACNIAYAQQSTPEVSECNQHSEGAPEGCVCLSEDRVLDAAAELRVCRDRVPLSFDEMTWVERGVWITIAVLGVVFI